MKATYLLVAGLTVMSGCLVTVTDDGIGGSFSDGGFGGAFGGAGGGVVVVVDGGAGGVGFGGAGGGIIVSDGGGGGGISTGGNETCDDLYTNGWDTGVDDGDFVDQDAADAYDALNDCACTALISGGGCADLCDKDQNGNPNVPNFCNGSAALPQCDSCIQETCGDLVDTCTAN